jgi:hypothetical protein
MAAPLVERSTGDVIPASDHNDVKEYIEDGLYRVNTLALEINGEEVISGAKVLSNVSGSNSLWDNDENYIKDFEAVSKGEVLSCESGVVNGDLFNDLDITTDGTYATTTYIYENDIEGDNVTIFKNKRSLQLDFGASSADGWVQFNNFLNIKQGKKYRMVVLSGTSKRLSNSIFNLVLDGTGQNIGTINMGFGNWRYRVLDFTATNDASFLRITTSETTPRDFFISDISLFEVQEFDDEITNISEAKIKVKPKNTYLDIDQESLVDDSAQGFGNDTYNKIAQQFKPTQNKMSGITLIKATDTGTLPNNKRINVTIREDDSGSPSSDILARTTITMNDSTSLLWNTYSGETFIPIPCILDADGTNTYWIVLETDSYDDVNHPNIKISDASDPYSDGVIKFTDDDETTWDDTGFTDKAFYFKTHYAQIPQGMGVIINGRKSSYLNPNGITGGIYDLNNGDYLIDFLKLPETSIAEIYDALPSETDNIPYNFYWDTTLGVEYNKWKMDKDIGSRGFAWKISMPERLKNNLLLYTPENPNSNFPTNWGVNNPDITSTEWIQFGDVRTMNSMGYPFSKGFKDYNIKFEFISLFRYAEDMRIVGFLDIDKYRGLIYPVNKENQFTEYVELAQTTNRIFFIKNYYVNEDDVVMPAIVLKNSTNEFTPFKVILLPIDNSQEDNPCINIVIDETTNAQQNGTGSNDGANGYILNDEEYMNLTADTDKLKITYKVGTGTTTFSNITKNAVYLFSNQRSVNAQESNNFKFDMALSADDSGIKNIPKLINNIYRDSIESKHKEWIEYKAKVSFEDGTTDADEYAVNQSVYVSDRSKTNLNIRFEITDIGTGDREKTIFTLPTKPRRDGVFMAYSSVQATAGFVIANINAEDQTIEVATTQANNGVIELNITYEEDNR